MDKVTAYSTLSQQSFSIGDEVKILRSADSGEWGWPGKWADEMDAAVGVIGIVTSAGEDGVTVRGKGNSSSVVFDFPFFVLEKQVPEFHTIKVDGLSHTISHELFLVIQNMLKEILG